MNIFGEKHVNNQQRCECRIPPIPQKHGKKCMASFLESGSIFHSYIHLQAALETNHLTTLGYASKIASRSSMKKRPRANGQWGRERNIQRPPEISCPARDWSENCFIHLSGISLSLSLLEALVWLFPPLLCLPSIDDPIQLLALSVGGPVWRGGSSQNSTGMDATHTKILKYFANSLKDIALYQNLQR